MQLHPQLQGHVQIKVIDEEQQVGAGVPGEEILSKELHLIRFKFHHASLVGDAEDLITSKTALSFDPVTTKERENNQWGEQVATTESMQQLTISKLNTSLPW